MEMLSRLSIRRPVTTIMIILMVFLAGSVSYSTLNLALMPDVNLPIALVQVTYVGAGPSEIESLVTEPLEESLSTISNVENIYSVSSNNAAIVIVQFVDGTDIDMAAVDMRESVDRVKSSLPDDASDPLVLKMDMNAIPIQIGVNAKNMDLTDLNDLIEDEISPTLERIEGVASVSTSGGIEREVRVTVNPDTLAAYGLSTSSLSSMLSAENMNLPAGSVQIGNQDISVRLIGEFESVDEIRNLPITTGTGALIRLSDIATVEEVEVDRDSFSLINGETGMIISVDKQSTANLVKVSDRLETRLNELREEYPDLDFMMLTDTSSYIKISISNVTSTAFLSAFLAFLVLLVFLKDPFTSLIVAVSIPTSIMATFALMYLTDLSLNIISMGGLSIGIGMLVDNSIVVLESVYQYHEKGYRPAEAAERGAKEVAMAVLASTLTTVAVFLPMSFVGGTVGDMMKSLSFTICFALISSLVVSLTFVPMACALLLDKKKGSMLKSGSRMQKILNRWDDMLVKLSKSYEKLLAVALHHKRRTVAVVLGVFLLSLCTIPIAGFDYMDEMDQGQISISVDTPAGASLDDKEEVVREILYRLESYPEIETVYASVGGGSVMSMSSSGSSSSVTVNLVDKEDRKRGIDEIVVDMQENLGTIAGADISVGNADSASAMLSGSDLSLNIYGYDMDSLMQAEQDMIDLLSNTPGFTNVEGTTEDSVPEARVYIDRAKASQYGINTSYIAGALSAAMNGTTATSYEVGGTEMDVMIRYQDTTAQYLTDLDGLMVPTASGGRVPLSDVARVEVQQSATSINRENQKNYVTVSANANGLSGNEVQKLAEEALKNLELPDDCYYEFSGTLDSMNEGFEQLGLALIVAVLLVYMIMASQFESLISPTIIMFSMPLAITGAIFGLLLTGKSITMASFMGFIMLAGMVVNNAIVLVDYTNQLRDRQFGTTYECLLEAGRTRLRPILMTTLTTILGLVPSALSNATGSEMMKGLSIAVIFGLMLSTLVTLVFIPVLYAMVDDVKAKRKQKKETRKAKKSLA